MRIRLAGLAVSAWLALAALTVAALTTACAGAQAKTVTVGSALTGSFTPAPIGLLPPPCCSYPYFARSAVGPRQAYPGLIATPLTLLQWTLPEPGTTVNSPVDGTVIFYRVAAADGTFAIQVIRSRSYTIARPPYPPYNGVVTKSIGTSTPTHISSAGVSSPIRTHLAVKSEDRVGIRNFGAGDQLGLEPNGGSVSAWNPPLVDGAPAGSNVEEYSYSPLAGEIGMQATVRFCRVPSVEGKSLAAARKILTRADCRVGKLKQTNHVRARTEVIFQSVQPGFAVSDTKPIKLSLSR